MPGDQNVLDAKGNFQPSQRILHSMLDKRSNDSSHFLRKNARAAAFALAAMGLLFTLNGCIATRSWVTDQLNPITSQLNNTNDKADRALSGLQNLRLEQRLVLDSRQGPTFAFGSAALTDSAKREINGFFQDLNDSSDSGPASGRLFIVAGYTDNVGAEDYNYQLGQRRAEGVVGYLVAKEGVDPTQVRAVSYGSSKPIADNSTSRGRQSNRRVEILVYQEKVAAGS